MCGAIIFMWELTFEMVPMDNFTETGWSLPCAHIQTYIHANALYLDKKPSNIRERERERIHDIQTTIITSANIAAATATANVFNKFESICNICNVRKSVYAYKYIQNIAHHRNYYNHHPKAYSTDEIWCSFWRCSLTFECFRQIYSFNSNIFYGFSSLNCSFVLLAIASGEGEWGWAQKLHCVECVLRYFLFGNICETNKHLRSFIHSDTKSHRTEQTFLFSPFSISYVDKMNVLFHLWFTRK